MKGLRVRWRAVWCGVVWSVVVWSGARVVGKGGCGVVRQTRVAVKKCRETFGFAPLEQEAGQRSGGGVVSTSAVGRWSTPNRHILYVEDAHGGLVFSVTFFRRMHAARTTRYCFRVYSENRALDHPPLLDTTIDYSSRPALLLAS